VSPRLTVVKPDDGKVIHTCSCGKTFTALAWDDLVLVGFIVDEICGSSALILENRNCPCGSTRGIKISFERLVTLFNNQCKSVRRATSNLVEALRVRGEVPDRDPEKTGPVELVRIEREACAQEAEKAAADLRLLANSRQGSPTKHSLFQRAELADEIAQSIRRRT